MPKVSMSMALGSVWNPFWQPLETPQAPKHAPGGSMCSRDAWINFGCNLESQREPKCIPKSIYKSMKCGGRVSIRFGSEHEAKMEPKHLPKRNPNS